jgi:carbonic anhydrase/acetyltransferase-like protein (isoleucine patch superfamily)
MLDPTSYVAPTATLIGAVTLAAEASVWFGAVLRGDVAPVVVGPRTNVQDGCVLHGEADTPTILGADCTLGHGAIVHGARLGDRVLVGMGAVVLSRAVVGDDVIIGAGAVVPEGSAIPAGVLVLGVPGRVVRPLSAEERARIAASAVRYAGYMATYRATSAED